MNSKKCRNIVLLLFAVTFIISGCKSNSDGTSNLLILEENYTDSVEENPTEISNLEENPTEITNLEDNEWSEIETADTAMLSVYICGAINQPGVYELEEGSRIYHIIELAGGMTEEAAESYLNLAEELVDGQKIYVPTKVEVEEGGVAALNWSLDDENSSGKVNINTATKEELMTLTGIGEAKAESIIEYRESTGAFENIEDIQNIAGIKEGVYSQIEDEITVD